MFFRIIETKKYKFNNGTSGDLFIDTLQSTIIVSTTKSCRFRLVELALFALLAITKAIAFAFYLS